MAYAVVGTAQRAALGVVALLAAGYACAAPTAPSCQARLRAAYTSASLPADLRQLCDDDHDPDRRWLASIELGAQIDIVRYGDLLQLAADLDRPAQRLSLVDTLLPEILAETSRPALPPPSWAERVRAWLRERLGGRDGVAPQWLQDWLTRFTAHRELLDVLLRITVVLTLVGALYVVLREVEIGGGWRRLWRRSGRHAPPALRAAPAAATPLRWSDVLALPVTEQPSALLHWLLLELHTRQLLPSDTSLTNRELLTLLRTPHPTLHAPFAALLDALEPYLYGAHPLPSIDALTVQVTALHNAAQRR
jgi:hypothetical protein